MSDDDRLSLKLRPDVGEQWLDKKPDEMTHSEFAATLLEDAEIETGVTADEILAVVREANTEQTEELLAELRPNE